VAFFTISPQGGETGEIITFNASASYDQDGSIIRFIWDFGDGYTGSGEVVTHTYADNGRYIITLTVMDNDSARDSTTENAVITNRSPSASFTESAETSYVGTPIEFNASASYDPDGTIVSYLWDFGDGTNTTGVTANHTYLYNGSFTVTLTVTDDDGDSTIAQATKAILGGLHDVAVMDVDPSDNEVLKYHVLNVSVVVANEGAEYETFNVTLYSVEELNSSAITGIETITVPNLAPGSQTIIIFAWNSSNTLSGHYFINAVASDVSGENNTSNNSFVSGLIEIKKNPDLDGDGDVDIFDVVIVTSLYGCQEGEPSWNPRADTVEDGIINIFDVTFVTSYYGKPLP
jgi:PKD repeat protein